MAHRQKYPRNAYVCDSYSDLKENVRGFARRHFPLLILIGGPGLGKTRVSKEVAGPGCHWMLGRVTPLQLYCQAYLHRHTDLAFDDVDDICRERQSVGILKDLCQTEASKEVAWYSSSAYLEDEGIPRRFTTTSHVLLIFNDWQTANRKLAAVEDRAHIVFFEPTPWEVHRETAKWFTDQEVFDFLGEYLHVIEEPSMRLYQVSLFRKNAGLDWKQMLLQELLPETRARVARLRADSSFAREEDRVRAFTAAGGSRATYFRHAKALSPPQSPPRISLGQQPG